MRKLMMKEISLITISAAIVLLAYAFAQEPPKNDKELKPTEAEGLKIQMLQKDIELTNYKLRLIEEQSARLARDYKDMQLILDKVPDRKIALENEIKAAHKDWNKDAYYDWNEMTWKIPQVKK